MYVACEQCTLPIVHDSGDDFTEHSVNSNVEQEVLQEYCSPHSADAAATSVKIDGNHQDISSTNVQQAQ